MKDQEGVNFLFNAKNVTEMPVHRKNIHTASGEARRKVIGEVCVSRRKC